MEPWGRPYRHFETPCFDILPAVTDREDVNFAIPPSPSSFPQKRESIDQPAVKKAQSSGAGGEAQRKRCGGCQVLECIPA